MEWARWSSANNYAGRVEIERAMEYHPVLNL